MKKSIIAILAVFLAAALFIGAGSAVTIFPNTDLSATTNLTAGDTLYLITAPNTVITIEKTSADVPYFTDKNLVAGTYSLDVGGTQTNYVVSYPDVKLNIYLNGTDADMNGKTVSSQSGLRFTGTEILSGYTLKSLKFITPAGGETSFLGNVNSSDPANWDSTYNSFTVDTLYDAKVSAGTWTVKPVVNGTFLKDGEFKTTTKTSPTKYTFTVGSTVDSITSNKDKVTRGNSFLLTIEGVPGKDVYVTYDTENLAYHDGQSGIKPYTDSVTGDKGFKFEMGNSGKKVVQMDTNSSTKEDTYKIQANIGGSNKNVKVVVEKGKITIVSDAPSYYIGNEVTLSGINTETDEVYLYVKGSNKELQEIPDGINSWIDDAIVVDSDHSWEKKFTFANEFDAGTYTIYAVANNYTVTEHKASIIGNQKDYQYATAAVTLKQPFLSATAASNTIASGDKIKISGQVEGTPKSLAYYIFGTNYFKADSISINDDGTYSKEIETADLSTGQYFVVVQHPMYDGLFNVVSGLNTTTYIAEDDFKYVVSSWATNKDGSLEKPARDIISAINTRQTANAAQAVCDLIDEQYVDDIYVKLDFVVANAYVTINAIADQTQGATFKVSGTTNVAVDENVVLDVVSTKFQAEPKESISAASYLVQTAKVVAGSNGVNTYEATFDGTPLAIDSYTAFATITRPVGSSDLKVSTTFNIVKGAATPVPTTTGTAAPVTPTATATATPTPASPGFGALIALAGLGAVAVLVLRRQ